MSSIVTYPRGITGGGVEVKLGDSGSVDAFSRVRVSDPYTQFDWSNQYSPATLANQQFWDVAVVGSGTATPRTTGTTIENSVRLTTGGTTDTHAATIQTKAHHIYQPGRSRLVEQTFVMGAAATNGLCEIGYGNANDGIFLQRSGSTIQFVRRTNVTGTPSDAAAVAKSSWNIDKFDGTGPSGVTLDLTKTNILVIDLQYLGVGRVRCGFSVNGRIYYAHEFLSANSLSTVYMTTGSLPLRARVLNNGTTSAAQTMDVICSAVVSEGGFSTGNYPQFAASNAVSAISTGTTLVPLISIRPATSFNSVTFRGQIIPVGYSVVVASQVHEIQLVKNGSLGGGTSWAAADATYSAAEFDVASTTISGGISLARIYVAASAATRAAELGQLFSRSPIVYTSLNNTQETLTVAARTVTSTGTAFAAIDWQEIY